MTKTKVSAKINKVDSTPKVKTVSGYAIAVNKAHKLYKEIATSLGGARALMLAVPEVLPANWVAILEASKKPANYRELARLVRKSTAGRYPVYYLRQALYKYEAHLLEKYALPLEPHTAAYLRSFLAAPVKKAAPKAAKKAA